MHCLRTERMGVSCNWRAGIAHNFPALLSLYVAKETPCTSSTYKALLERGNDLCTGQLPISMGISEVPPSEWCSWICSCSCVLLCTSPPYVKPGPVFKSASCKWKYLELLASWHVAVILSYLEPFWTHFLKSSLFTRECKWFILVNYGQALQPKYLLGVGEGWREEITGGEKHGRTPPTPSRRPQCFTPSFSLLYWMVYKSCSWLEFSLLTVLYTYKYIYKYINIFLFSAL